MKHKKIMSGLLTAAVLAAAMLHTIFASAADTDYKIYKFTSDNDYTFLDAAGMSKGDSPVGYWPTISENSSMTFSFDGSKTKIADGKTYDMNGEPLKIQFAVFGHGSPTYTAAVEKSTDGTTYNTVENGLETDWINEALYQTLGRASYTTKPTPYTISADALSGAKKIRVTFTGVSGTVAVARPTIKYKAAQTEDFYILESVEAGNTVKVRFKEAMNTDTITAENFTIKDKNGSSVEITKALLGPEAAVKTTSPLNEYIATLTLSKNLAPLSDYTITVSDAVKTAAGNSLTKTSDTFKSGTTVTEITYKHDNVKWEYGEGLTTMNFGSIWTIANASTGYVLFNFDGSVSGTVNGTTYDFDGTPSWIKLMLACDTNGTDLTKAVVSAIDGDGDKIGLGSLADYELQNDGHGNLWTPHFNGGMNTSNWTNKFILISEEFFPAGTKAVRIDFNQSWKIGMIRPVISYKIPDYKFTVQTVDGLVPASKSVKLVFDKAVDPSSIDKTKVTLTTSTGENTAVSDVVVSGNTVTLFLAAELARYTNYNVSMGTTVRSTAGLKMQSSGTFRSGGATKTLSFTDDGKSSDWLTLNNMEKNSNGTWKGWYAIKNNNQDGSITISLDGTKTKTVNGKKYNLSGVFEKLQFAVMTFNYKQPTDINIYVSEDGVNYTSIGTAFDSRDWNEASLYQHLGLEVTGKWKPMPVVLNKDKLGENTKYIKLTFPADTQSSSGFIMPTVTYKTPVDGYEPAVSYTDADGNSIKAIANGTVNVQATVDFNYDQEETSADVYIINALYENGRLKETAVSGKQTVAKSGSYTFDSSFNVTDAENAEIVTFVWNGLEDIIPLTSPVRFR